MKKKWLVVIGVAILVSIFATAAFADNSIKLFVNGQEIKTDVPPQIINGRTMVPVRWIAEALGADIQWDGQNNAVKINKPYFVSSLPEAEARLYPFQEINGMYDGFILEVKGNRKYFDWKNVTNPTYAPQLFFNDINQDSEKELIVILTTGTGTGFHTEDIHILTPGDFTEIDVEEPDDIVKQHINTKIESDGDDIAIQIITGSEETTIHKEKGYAATWFDNVVFGNSYCYEVIDNELVVSIRAQVSPAYFIGEIKAAYVFDNGKYRAKRIKFTNQDESDKTPTVYKNIQYGFSFSLPESRQGYSIIKDKWEGLIREVYKIA